MKNYPANGDTAKAILGIVFFVVVLSLVFVWKSGVWTECRADGKSFGYCASLVSR